MVQIAGGIGAGKSYISALCATVRCKDVPLIWIVGPDYTLCEPEFFEVQRFLEHLDLIDNVLLPRAGSKEIVTRFGGHIVTRTSAVSSKKLAGRGPGVIILTEAAQQPYSVFQAAQERLSRSETVDFYPCLIMSGSFEQGDRWYVDLFYKLQGENEFNGASYSVPSWTNPHLYPEGYDDPKMVEIRRKFADDVFQERFGAIPVKPSGIVLPEFDSKVHVSRTICKDMGDPVILWIDPGWSGCFYAVEVAQIFGDEVHLIDEIYMQYKTHGEVIAEVKKRPWGSRVRYCVIDNSAGAHIAAQSAVEEWRAARFVVKTIYLKVEDGINRHRTFLKSPLDGAPRLYLSPRCTGAIREYNCWKRKRAPDHSGFLSEAEKSNCDAMKAINYGLVEHFGLVPYVRPAPIRKGKSWR